MHLLKRKYIFGDDLDTEDEEEEQHNEHGLPIEGEDPRKRLMIKKEDD